MGRINLPERYTNWGAVYTPPGRDAVIKDGLVWVKLTHGLVSVCDTQDFEAVANKKWQAHIRTMKRGGLYIQATGAFFDGERWKSTKMHRAILDAKEGEEVDHINLDTLDNRRQNIRIVTHHQNLCNMGKRPKGSSQYKGVCWREESGLWVAQIQFQGSCNNKNLGYYKTEVDAAFAYNEAAKRMFGEYAQLNKIPEGVEITGRQYRKTGKTGWIGVDACGEKYVARIYAQGKARHLGMFATPEDAALAYNEAALKYRGPNARLNVLPEGVKVTGKKSYRVGKLGFIGVGICGHRYYASIGSRDDAEYLGSFDTLEEAALAYNEAALRRYGPNTRLNILP